MNFDICMKFTCKNCKKRLKCFKKEEYYENSKNEDSGAERSKIQSEKKIRKNRRKLQKNKTFEDFMIEEYSKKEKIYNEIFGKE